MKNIIMNGLAAVVCGLSASLSASEKTVFEADFNKASDLNGWQYFNRDVPTKDFVLVKEGETQILQTPAKGLYGISHKLNTPVVIDSNLKKVTLTIVLRQGTNPHHIIMPALSSRNGVVPNTSAPFLEKEDSGFYVSGCGFDSQRHHSMGYRIDGNEIIRTTPEIAPRNMSEWEKWCTWSIVLDNEKKTLEAKTSVHPEHVVMSLKNVKMDGIKLNSVFLPSQNTCYKSIKVTVE